MRYQFPHPALWRMLRLAGSAAILGTLVSCATAPSPAPETPPPRPSAPPIEQARSRWVPMNWESLPGWKQDQVYSVRILGQPAAISVWRKPGS